VGSPVGIEIVLLSKHLGAPGNIAAEALPLCLPASLLHLSSFHPFIRLPWFFLGWVGAAENLPFGFDDLR
jgi:hypothetical protein